MILIRKIWYLSFMFVIANLISAQDYCPEKKLLLEKYQAGDYIKAKAYIDTVLLKCPSQKTNAYFWHISAFINFNIFQKVDQKSPLSKARKEAVSSVLKSMELDKDNKYLEHNKQILDVLANGYYNHYVSFLDTNNYVKALDFFQEFKALKKVTDQSINFNQYEIQHCIMLAQIYKQLYHNDENSTHFIQKAIDSYQCVLSIDENNYNANKNLGILYHNLGVETIMKELPVDADLEVVIVMEEKAVNYFTKSLPYLKKFTK